MSKQEFLAELRKGLLGLPQGDIEERLNFYSEMIDDRMEEGMTEEDAVRDMGAVEDIVAQVVVEIPLSRLVREKVKPKRALQAWEIVLLILGSPIWVSLLLAAVAVVLSVYVVLWSVMISLWAVAVSLVGGCLGGVVCAVAFAVLGNTPGGIAMLGVGLACAGVSILLFIGCGAATKGIVILTKKMTLGMKKVFMKRRNEA